MMNSVTDLDPEDTSEQDSWQNLVNASLLALC